MNKNKVLKILIIIVSIIILCILINTIRKFIIISKLQNELSEYSKSTNYYTKTTIIDNEQNKVIMEYYKKDNKQMVKIQKMENNSLATTLMYDNGSTVNIYLETEQQKVAKIDSGMNINVNLYNHLESYNSWNTFCNCFLANIKSENVDGNDCYVIKNFNSLTSLPEKSKIYVNKENGLLIKSIEESQTTNKTYEFRKC